MRQESIEELKNGDAAAQAAMDGNIIIDEGDNNNMVVQPQLTSSNTADLLLELDEDGDTL